MDQYLGIQNGLIVQPFSVRFACKIHSKKIFFSKIRRNGFQLYFNPSYLIFFCEFSSKFIFYNWKFAKKSLLLNFYTILELFRLSLSQIFTQNRKILCTINFVEVGVTLPSRASYHKISSKNLKNFLPEL